eukprot:25683-Eustigmatos_ZCMA.PRE.1
MANVSPLPGEPDSVICTPLNAYVAPCVYGAVPPVYVVDVPPAVTVTLPGNPDSEPPTAELYVRLIGEVSGELAYVLSTPRDDTVALP